ncbi:hypothetical protein BJ742DRAFT_781343 [Cladochytrium replicatum]|nr:hypothetical protein BJ742DRAFT_781343 [Cladochytrium replicatum]
MAYRSQDPYAAAYMGGGSGMPVHGGLAAGASGAGFMPAGGTSGGGQGMRGDYSSISGGFAYGGRATPTGMSGSVPGSVDMRVPSGVMYNDFAGGGSGGAYMGGGGMRGMNSAAGMSAATSAGFMGAAGAGMYGNPAMAAAMGGGMGMGMGMGGMGMGMGMGGYPAGGNVPNPALAAMMMNRNGAAMAMYNDRDLAAAMYGRTPMGMGSAGGMGMGGMGGMGVNAAAAALMRENYIAAMSGVPPMGMGMGGGSGGMHGGASGGSGSGAMLGKDKEHHKDRGLRYPRPDLEWEPDPNPRGFEEYRRRWSDGSVPMSKVSGWGPSPQIKYNSLLMWEPTHHAQLEDAATPTSTSDASTYNTGGGNYQQGQSGFDMQKDSSKQQNHALPQRPNSAPLMSATQHIIGGWGDTPNKQAGPGWMEVAGGAPQPKKVGSDNEKGEPGLKQSADAPASGPVGVPSIDTSKSGSRSGAVTPTPTTAVAGSGAGKTTPMSSGGWSGGEVVAGSAGDRFGGLPSWSETTTREPLAHAASSHNLRNSNSQSSLVSRGVIGMTLGGDDSAAPWQSGGVQQQQLRGGSVGERVWNSKREASPNGIWGPPPLDERVPATAPNGGGVGNARWSYDAELGGSTQQQGKMHYNPRFGWSSGKSGDGTSGGMAGPSPTKGQVYDESGDGGYFGVGGGGRFDAVVGVGAKWGTGAPGTSAGSNGGNGNSSTGFRGFGTAPIQQAQSRGGRGRSRSPVRGYSDGMMGSIGMGSMGMGGYWEDERIESGQANAGYWSERGTMYDSRVGGPVASSAGMNVNAPAWGVQGFNGMPMPGMQGFQGMQGMHGMQQQEYGRYA